MTNCQNITNQKKSKMKNIAFYVVLFCILASMLNCNGLRKSNIDLEVIHKQNVQNSTLVTGWYHIVAYDNGFKRQLDKSDKIFFINPKPIVVKEHFEKLEILESRFGEYFLSIQIGRRYWDLWAEATGSSIGKRLAFVINDKLVHVPTVNSRITGGASALNRSDYSREELEDFIKQIIGNRKMTNKSD